MLTIQLMVALQEATKNANGATAGDFQLANGADFACPLTGLPMNGRYRFSVLRKTGHVLSEKALKEVRLWSHFLSPSCGYADKCKCSLVRMALQAGIGKGKKAEPASKTMLQ